MARSARRIVRIHFESIGSTNVWAIENMGSLDMGALTVVSADHQTAGRGRFERAWHDEPSDSMIATFCARVAHPRFYLMAAVLPVAAVSTLRELGVADVGIKWPNDVVVGQRKCAGVLCEARALDGPEGGSFLALGIGINVNTAPDALAKMDRPRWPATSLAAATGRRWSVAEVREALTRHVAEVRSFGGGARGRQGCD